MYNAELIQLLIETVERLLSIAEKQSNMLEQMGAVSEMESIEKEQKSFRHRFLAP